VDETSNPGCGISEESAFQNFDKMKELVGSRNPRKHLPPFARLVRNKILLESQMM